MLPSALDTGVLQVLKVVVEAGRSVVGHGGSSAKVIKASSGPSVVPRSLAILPEVAILMRRPCGVTEAACKVIVKQRLCGSGMKGVWQRFVTKWAIVTPNPGRASCPGTA